MRHYPHGVKADEPRGGEEGRPNKALRKSGDGRVRARGREIKEFQEVGIRPGVGRGTSRKSENFFGNLMLVPSYYSPNQCSPHPAARCTADLSTAAKATAAPAKPGARPGVECRGERAVRREQGRRHVREGEGRGQEGKESGPTAAGGGKGATGEDGDGRKGC